MSAFFSAIYRFFNMLATWLLDGAKYVLQFVIYSLLDGLLTVITLVFQGLDLTNRLGTYVCDWSGLPSQMGYVIGQCGIPACIAVLMGAISIRVLINLIPSWATRV